MAGCADVPPSVPEDSAVSLIVSGWRGWPAWWEEGLELPWEGAWAPQDRSGQPVVKEESDWWNWSFSPSLPFFLPNRFDVEHVIFLFSLKIYEEILCLKLKWFIIFSKTTFTSKYYFTTVRIVSFLLFLQFSLMFSLVCVLPPEPPHLVSYRNYLQRIEVSESRITSVRSPVATLFP